MINRKIATVALGLTAMALTACGATDNGGSGTTGSTDITYWCPETDSQFMEGVVTRFKEANPDFKGTIRLLANVGEGDVKSEIQKDPSAAADVVCIADDNIRDLVSSRSLLEFDTTETAEIVKNNGASNTSAAQVGGKTYGIPYRGDNGYQLIYDKALVSADDCSTLEGLLKEAKDGGYKVGFDIGNGWYIASLFFANDIKLEYNGNGDFTTDINSDKGLAMLKSVYSLYTQYKDTWLIDSNATGFGTSAASRKCAQIIWNAYDDIKTAVGEDNVGVAALPTINIGGTAKHLYTYAGVKAISVVKKSNATDERNTWCKAFAKYIASSKEQENRLTTLNQGVTDLSVVAKTDLWTSPFLVSLAKQEGDGYSQVQSTHANGNYWDAAAKLMATITGATTTLTDDDLKSALETCQAAILKE